MSDTKAGCRFCLANGLLIDTPWYQDDDFFCLGSIDPVTPNAVIIVPRRHSETPFELNAREWAGFGDLLQRAKARMAPHNPDGYTIGWNVGAVGGQTVFHTHMHVVPRFAGEINDGAGLRRIVHRVKLLDAKV